jgi:glyoxylase-like metal-dependent hydrolase (beta-lactamase superfamily II)
MNLVRASSPERSGLDELVPSRYALKVGALDVLIVSDGILPLPTTTMATNAAPEALAAWLDHMFLPRDKFDWPLNVMVARNGDRTILVDSGVGRQFSGFPRAGQLMPRLEAAGIDLGSITDVVLTHMHMDHVGGLLGEGVKEQLRPDLRIHVAEAEVKFWAAPDFSHTVMPSPVPDVLRATAKRFYEEYRSRLRIFEEKHEVLPGVVVHRTGGHTPGHSVVHLTHGGERLIFAGDAIFPVGFDQPDWQNGFEHDPEESTRVRIALLREVAATGALLTATHLPFPSVCRVALDGDAFRCVPAFWDF